MDTRRLSGPITELFDAIEEDRSPTVDGADHLRTLRVVEAAYESASRNGLWSSESSRRAHMERCPTGVDRHF